MHGNVLGIVEVCFRLHRFWKKLGICELFFCLPYKKCNQTKTMSQTFHELFKNYEFKTKTCSPFETLVDNFCSMYNKKEGCPFEITPEMIHQCEETYRHAHCDKPSPMVDVHRFVQHFGNNYVKKCGSFTLKKWGSATWINEPFGKGHDQNHYPLPKHQFNDCVLEDMRRRSYSLGRSKGIGLHRYHQHECGGRCNHGRRQCTVLKQEEALRPLTFMNAKYTMFEMCKQMGMLCTPKSNVQNMLLCLRRGAPKLYAVEDCVSQFESYLKFDFTEQDFINIMKSDQGALVLRLYCCWWILTMNHVLANTEALTHVSSLGKRVPIDNANVFVDRKAKRRRF